MIWLLLAGAILTEVAATLALRASEGFRRKRWIAPIVVLYVAAFSFLAAALANGMPVGIAYGIWAACGVALTAVGARVFFHEKLTPRMIVGIALIGLGVFVIEFGSQLAHG